MNPFFFLTAKVASMPWTTSCKPSPLVTRLYMSLSAQSLDISGTRLSITSFPATLIMSLAVLSDGEGSHQWDETQVPPTLE